MTMTNPITIDTAITTNKGLCKSDTMIARHNCSAVIAIPVMDRWWLLEIAETLQTFFHHFLGVSRADLAENTFYFFFDDMNYEFVDRGVAHQFGAFLGLVEQLAFDLYLSRCHSNLRFSADFEWQRRTVPSYRPAWESQIPRR